MLSNLATGAPAALFLFAHQDDEFGIFQKILDERQKGHRVCCAYLTDGGVSNRGATQRRDNESLSVLMKLGVHEQDVFFMGNELSIPDAGLPVHLEIAANWIHEWISGFSQVSSIYIPAWEGGHHDHDALHVITITLAEERGMLDRVWQFPLYNGYGCIGPLFKVCLPLPLNGEIEKRRISWGNRFLFLYCCLSYPSQTKTWIGLFPFVALHYLINGKQALQPVSLERIRLRPHDTALYYERRGFFTWEKMVACLAKWESDLERVERA